MTKADKYFIDTLSELMKKENSTQGENVRPKYKDGVEAHTYFITNKVFEYDLSRGEVPLISLRQQAWKSAIKEILWIYQDQTSDLSVLKEKYNIHWWDDWNVGDGTIGQRYGATIKKYDLVNKLLNDLKNNKNSRRMIMNMYQYEDFKETEGLFPCAFETLWNVRGEYLDMILTQRSSDFATAWSINEMQYACLQIMVAKASGLKPGKFTHIIGNLHIYDRHLEQGEELLKRTPSEKVVKLNFEPKYNDFYSFHINDFSLENYEPCEPQLKFELAI